ncbi:hypothetical protein immuto35A_121 [Flavobacterium phage vB_FspM_immuto_3-5A]|uniref:Uncharacterized protein n=1 Tax=Flavobacterium phage vB_FspM_immuto_2-6A TaxID=2801477 RepID=A0A7T8IWQ3_9CAUD|nr:hypothetical protein KNV73_gp149 [Flavobacterium phage vB_FspM_immuto_2-6A]QQO91801.1 hypothetical protein immuto26A_122 [Flavobacterium phage vB_FspM_immuto_2-6A]QQO92039.1 hypothetical protein immuto35A_121 [Flavobacterium phage vB_FspM_immuto_3-5A]QQO92277.1 hypothetical protein immuto136C_121 [Flavobacterium phage vB_FspM_immuto_13-6C]
MVTRASYPFCYPTWHPLETRSNYLFHTRFLSISSPLCRRG